MQAVRPGAILAPLQLSLGVQMHHHFASRFLIDTLSEHGFSCSYAEVQRYERSAAVAHGTQTTTYSEENFIQFIADNVDHNIVTLDGTGTFHGMGIIATITPKPQVCRPSIPKLHVTAEDIAAIGHINIDYFKYHHQSSVLPTSPFTHHRPVTQHHHWISCGRHLSFFTLHDQPGVGWCKCLFGVVYGMLYAEYKDLAAILVRSTLDIFPHQELLRTFSMSFWWPHRNALWQDKFCCN